MSRPTVDYLNARRAALAAGAGGAIRRDRLANPAAERERAAGLGDFEIIAERLAAFYRNMRGELAEERRRRATGIGGGDVPF